MIKHALGRSLVAKLVSDDCDRLHIRGERFEDILSSNIVHMSGSGNDTIPNEAYYPYPISLTLLEVCGKAGTNFITKILTLKQSFMLTKAEHMGMDIIKRFKFSTTPFHDVSTVIDNLPWHMKYFTNDLNQGKKWHNIIIEPSEWKLRYMYLLPKIHYPRNEWINDTTPKVDPLSPLAVASLITWGNIDSIINPWVVSHPQVLKSSHDLINEFKTLTGKLDYNNIEFIDFLCQHGLASESTMIGEIIRHDLLHQIFSFIGNIYRQDHGIPMGAPYSPSLANIYLFDQDNEMMDIPNLLFYKRYIDVQPSLKFGDFQRGNVVTFLDLVIWSNGNDSKIEYATHFKKLHAFNYINAASWHPRATKKGMIYSQFLRICLTNSNMDIREFYIDLLMRKFMLCCYTVLFLKRILNRVIKNQNYPTNATNKLDNVRNDKIFKHIRYHPHFKRINQKMLSLYEKEGIPCKFSFSYRNLKASDPC
ncbi:hypothetical protein RF11_16365 [Thelohanellus kitauei]|uniref:Reverse transcriptase domain-containing protein n=1 Tax=Thelohanellus kitauei TaxID=669202 RepID=A0A0C2J3B6_THEKT|nr:hypothetical protein RF11_16365 [Thelohanellus kitauei]